jgi:guanylate kinase
MTSGKLIVITGPSGVGKGTLVRLLLAQHPGLVLSISATTRPPRSGEIDGKDYFFVSRETFTDMIALEQFLEWAEYAGNYYGTPRAPVEKSLREGQSIILEIEVQGARQIKTTFPEALRVFILPPSLGELERRLIDRAKDTEDVIERRLQKAQEELAVSGEFDYQIVNNDLESALAAIATAIFGLDR